MTHLARFEDSAAYRKGAGAEQTVEQVLQGRGFYTIRLCNIRNHEGIGAPMMMGARSNLILPDYQVVDCQGAKPPFLPRSNSSTSPP